MIKKLLEERAVAIGTIKEMSKKINDENRCFTSEEQETWEKVNKDYDNLSSRIEALQRSEEVTNKNEIRKEIGREESNIETRKETAPEEVKNIAFRGWLRSKLTGDVRKDEIDAIEKCGVNIGRKELRGFFASHSPKNEIELRAMSTVKGASIIPTGFVLALEEALLAFSGVRQVASVNRTTSGNELPFPTVNDTANKGARLAESIDEMKLIIHKEITGFIT